MFSYLVERQQGFPARQGGCGGGAVSKSSRGLVRALVRVGALSRPKVSGKPSDRMGSDAFDALENAEGLRGDHPGFVSRVFPLPHPALCRARAVTLRLLQARAYPNPAVLHAIYPERYASADCPACGQLATLNHVLWECEAIGSTFSEDRWAALLRSPELHDQTLAVQSARERAAKLGLAVPTWD